MPDYPDSSFMPRRWTSSDMSYTHVLTGRDLLSDSEYPERRFIVATSLADAEDQALAFAIELDSIYGGNWDVKVQVIHR